MTSIVADLPTVNKVDAGRRIEWRNAAPEAHGQPANESVFPFGRWEGVPLIRCPWLLLDWTDEAEAGPELYARIIEELQRRMLERRAREARADWS